MLCCCRRAAGAGLAAGATIGWPTFSTILEDPVRTAPRDPAADRNQSWPRERGSDRCARVGDGDRGWAVRPVGRAGLLRAAQRRAASIGAGADPRGRPQRRQEYVDDRRWPGAGAAGLYLSLRWRAERGAGAAARADRQGVQDMKRKSNNT